MLFTVSVGTVDFTYDPPVPPDDNGAYFTHKLSEPWAFNLKQVPASTPKPLFVYGVTNYYEYAESPEKNVHTSTTVSLPSVTYGLDDDDAINAGYFSTVFAGKYSPTISGQVSYTYAAGYGDELTGTTAAAGGVWLKANVCNTFNGDTSSKPVHYADGSAVHVVNDFLPSGGGLAASPTRSWSNGSYSDNDQVIGFGNGMSFDGLPYLEYIGYFGTTSAYQTVSPSFAVVTRSNSAYGVFGAYEGKYVNTASGEDAKNRFEQVGSTIKETCPDGTVVLYADFSSAYASNKQGRMISRTTPAGDSTVVNWNSGGTQVASISYTYTTTSGSTTSSQTESYAFTYASGTNQVTRVVQSRNGTAIRTVDYTYYTSSGTNGNAGDLKYVTKRNGDASSAVIGTDYYRWYTSNTSTGYAGGLKTYLGQDANKRALQDYGSASALEAAPQFDSGSTVGLTNYVDNYFEYITASTLKTLTGKARVSKEIAMGAGQGCSCGKTGEGTYTFTYAVNSSTAARDNNTWCTKTTETLPDGSQNIVYTNSDGFPILKIVNDVAASKQYLTWKRFDSDGHIIMQAEGNALSGYSESFADLVGYQQSGTYLAGGGRIDVTNYFTAADSVDATLVGYQKSTGYQIGASGSFIPTESWTYTDGGVTGDGVWNIATDTTYPNASNATIKRITSYSYDSFWQISGVNTAQPKVVTTSLPQVSTSQNGHDSSTGSSSTYYQTKSYYDSADRLIWYVDGSGFISYFEYDPLTRAKTKEIDDANPSSITTAAVAGPTRSGSLATALGLTTAIVVDSQGRKTKVTDPDGNVTYTVYDDTTADGDPRKVITYVGWNASTHQPTGPVYATIDDPATGTRDSISYTYSASGGLPVDTNGVPTGAEWISTNRANITLRSLVRQKRNVSDQLIETQEFTDFTGITYTPGASGWSSIGTAGTNYLSTKYKYDSGGRLYQTTTPAGTINTSVFDARGLVQSTWTGTNNASATESDPTGGGASGNNMVKTAGFAYDNDGNQTQMTQYPHDGSLNRVSKMYYDRRDRLVATLTDSDTGDSAGDETHFIQYNEYDNLGEATAVSSYEYGGDVSVIDANNDGVPDKPSSELLKAKTVNAYDDQGRVYRSSTYSVDPSTGTVSSGAIQSDTWYDVNGRVMESHTSGAATTKISHDGAGREIAQFVVDASEDGGYEYGGIVTYNTVLEQVETTYDAAGNVILSTRRQRFHDAAASGALGDPSSTGGTAKARVSYEATYYDAANRMTADVNVGTNAASAYTRPSSTPSRSDTVLVSSYGYDLAGKLFSTTDPKGIESRTIYDNAGRTTATIENYVDGTPSAADDRTTTYAYGSNGLLSTQTATMPSGTNSQSTQYVYGATTSRGDSIFNNDMLIAVRYPDPTTGSASTGQQETYTSDALGETKTKTDRNGSVHTYTYDILGRQTSDAVTTLGTGVDGAVRRIDTEYDSQGNAFALRSYNTASGSGVVNQVYRLYNGLGQLTTEYQATGGSVNFSTTPKVQYGYGALANGSRPTSMTYPNGRVLTYNYASGTDGNVGRLSSITDGSTTLESYSYLGLGTVVERNHAEPGLKLTYVGSGTGDAGDKYTGLDRFGRITDQKWVNSSSTVLDEYTYTYDRNSNVLTKANGTNSALSEAYTYDNLNRLTATTRNSSAYQSWSLDPLGNMNSVTTSGTSVSRTNNSQNQLTALGSNTLAYDGNGNTTTDEQGRTLIYDAWNRLVEAKSGSTSLICYAFDALGRRVKEGTNSIYFSTGWQEIEDRNSSNQATASYAWSPVYVNAMIARDRDTDANGSLDERLHPTQDANWNVTSIANVSGTVLQHFAFDSYGERQVFTSSWSTTTDAYDFRQGFQGGTFDATLPHLILFQNRTYNTVTIRWLQEDPLGYPDGMSRYQFVRSNPVAGSDPFGLDTLTAIPESSAEAEIRSHVDAIYTNLLGNQFTYGGGSADAPFYDYGTAIKELTAKYSRNYREDQKLEIVGKKIPDSFITQLLGGSNSFKRTRYIGSHRNPMRDENQFTNAWAQTYTRIAFDVRIEEQRVENYEFKLYRICQGVRRYIFSVNAFVASQFVERECYGTSYAMQVIGSQQAQEILKVRVIFLHQFRRPPILGRHRP